MDVIRVNVHLRTREQLLHIAEHHTIKLCPECDLALPNKQDLKAHINETHLKCPECFTLFGSQKELKMHKKGAHNVSNVNTTKVSNVNTTNVTNVNTTNVNIQCHQCGNIFPDDKSLTAHVTSDHAEKQLPPKKQFPCKHCGKAFISGTDLTEHSESEHSHNHDKNCDCYSCTAKVKLPSICSGEKFYRLLIQSKYMNTQTMLQAVHIPSLHDIVSACAPPNVIVGSADF